MKLPKNTDPKSKELLLRGTVANFSESALSKNRATKALGVLFQEIDKNVEWVDYIAAEKSGVPVDLVAIGFKGKQASYIPVSRKASMLDFSFTVTKGMDEYDLSVLFLNESKLSQIRPRLAQMAINRAKLAMAASSVIAQGALSTQGLVRVFEAAREAGVFEKTRGQGFLEAQNRSAIERILSSFLADSQMTMIDTEILAGLIGEELSMEQNAQKDNKKDNQKTVIYAQNERALEPALEM